MGIPASQRRGSSVGNAKTVAGKTVTKAAARYLFIFLLLYFECNSHRKRKRARKPPFAPISSPGRSWKRSRGKSGVIRTEALFLYVGTSTNFQKRIVTYSPICSPIDRRHITNGIQRWRTP